MVAEGGRHIAAPLPWCHMLSHSPGALRSCSDMQSWIRESDPWDRLPVTAALEVVSLLVELGARAADDERVAEEEPLLWCVGRSLPAACMAQALSHGEHAGVGKAAGQGLACHCRHRR